MKNVVLFNLITLDGFFAGPNGEIDWHRVDDEFNDFAIEQLNNASRLIFGRVTYQMMASYWPTPSALKDDPIVANKMNSISKIVVSRTLKSADWSNTRLVNGNLAGEIAELKRQPGGDLFVFGSGDLAATMIEQGLIDQYRLLVNPVVLGSGMPMFKGIHQPLHFKLASTRSFRNGNVLLIYQA